MLHGGRGTISMDEQLQDAVMQSNTYQENEIDDGEYEEVNTVEKLP